MIIHKCDRKGCNAQFTQQKGTKATKPDDWYHLTWKNSEYGSNQFHYELCPKCRKALNIPDNPKSSHVGDQLLELIEEIACEAAQEAGA